MFEINEDKQKKRFDNKLKSKKKIRKLILYLLGIKYELIYNLKLIDYY